MQQRNAKLIVLVLALIMIPTQAFGADEELKTVLNQILLEVKALKGRVEALESQQGHQSHAEIAENKAAAKELDDITTATEKLAANNSASQDTQQNVGGQYQNNIFSNTTVGGYASLEFENFQDNDSTFDQHRLVLNVGSVLMDRIKFYSELEYEHGATIESEGSAEGELTILDTNGNGVIDASEAIDVPFDAETNSGRSGEIAVEQAWMQYDFNENVGLRAGVILVPFGKYNLTHDDDLHLLTDRPLVARRVIPTTWSESGLGLVSNMSPGAESSLSAEMYFVNGLNDDIATGGGALREAKGNFEQDNNNNKAVVGRLAYSPWIGTELGISGYHGGYDDAGHDINAGAVDWEFTYADFKFLGEGAMFDVEEGLNQDGNVVPENLSGMYAELNYAFWFESLNNTFLGKGFEDPKFVGVFRYNYAEIDRRGDQSTLDEDSYVVGLAYRPLPNFILKTEYQWNAGELERGDSDGFLGSFALGF